MLAWSGPERASHVVVLAPGDEGRLSDVAPTLIARGLATAGLRVVRFDFPSCEGDGAARDVVLAARLREAAAHRTGSQRLILGGMSRGARVSVALVDELQASGVLVYAYPFHARGDPDPGGRVEQLARVSVPVLMCQGTRDSHGNQQQILGYRLPAHIRIHWLEDANHALAPRSRSGQTQAEQLAESAEMAARFLRGHYPGRVAS